MICVTIMAMTDYNSIFWIEVAKINPNPYQPRQEFDEDKLRDLADSIRQYGVLQPLVVTRKEIEDDSGMRVEYELIAGERRWRASKLAGLYQVPAIIRSGDQTDKMKLEMAIIENLQREDLNPVDRAQAFAKLSSEFNLKHGEIAKKIGKSREYVANSVRVLGLPQEILDALMAGKISEGHTRPMLMLNDRPEEQKTIFQEIINKGLTVRDTESIARRIAYDKVRKKDTFTDPGLVELEEKLAEKFGTRVKVERRRAGGQITIDFFSPKDLEKIFGLLGDKKDAGHWATLAERPDKDYQAALAEASGSVLKEKNPEDVSSNLIGNEVSDPLSRDLRSDGREEETPVSPDHYHLSDESRGAEGASGVDRGMSEDLDPNPTDLKEDLTQDKAETETSADLISSDKFNSIDSSEDNDSSKEMPEGRLNESLKPENEVKKQEEDTAYVDLPQMTSLPARTLSKSDTPNPSPGVEDRPKFDALNDRSKVDLPRDTEQPDRGDLSDSGSLPTDQGSFNDSLDSLTENKSGEDDKKDEEDDLYSIKNFSI